jgi:organic radical activating enzyme
MKIKIKKDSEAAKEFESLRKDKQEFKKSVESGKIMPQHIKEKIDKLTGELKKVYELAEQSWEGCDGCDENDKNFFIKGFQAGYNTAKPDGIPRLMYKDGREIRSYHSPILDELLKETSDEEALRLAKEMNKQPMIFVPYEISDEEIENAWTSYQRECLEKFEKDTAISGYAITNKEKFTKWYREQLKNII